jgi:hypothetical protein
MSEPGTRGPADEPADTTPAPAAEEEASTEPDTEAGTGSEPATELVEEPRMGLRGRVLGFRVRLPRTRRGIFALLLVVGAFAFAGIWTSVTLVHWTETADFCGRCHSMGPELCLRDGPASRRHLR